MVEMHEKSDAQLLHEYAEGGNEAAFRELVVRHTDLVYSAALRQVGSPDLARDVAQSVFTDLARKAPSLTKVQNRNPSLLGWLYRSTRFAALNQLRDDRRRQARERQAMEHFDPVYETATDWDRVRPALDETMSDLSDEDREALLLRFFQNRDFRFIGQALGVSDDAAQKRVSRALEKLRAEFGRRGVTTHAVALSTALSANAVSVAPAGLAASLSTAALAGTTITTATAVTAAKACAMTTMQKTLIAATLAVAAGTGIYEARQASRLSDQIRALQQQQTPLTEQMQQLRRERDEATNRLATLADENATLKRNSAELLKLRGEFSRFRQELAQLQTGNSHDVTEAAKSWVNRVTQLKQRLEQTADAKIPELQYVTEQDWLNAARGELNSEADYRRALSALRSAGERKFASMIQKSLKNYQRANNDQMPTDMLQLKPYFDEPVGEAALQRWEVASAKTVQSLGLGGDVLITQREPVDDVFDTRFGVGPVGTGSTDFLSRELAATMNPVWEAFRAAHNGQWPDDVRQLQPYAATPEQQAALQKLMLRNSTEK